MPSHQPERRRGDWKLMTSVKVIAYINFVDLREIMSYYGVTTGQQ
jgi:hypothetical protein